MVDISAAPGSMRAVSGGCVSSASHCLSFSGFTHLPASLPLELGIVAQACQPCPLGCWAVSLQIQQSPKQQVKFKANLGNLVRSCLKLNWEVGIRSLVEFVHNMHEALDSNCKTTGREEDRGRGVGREGRERVSVRGREAGEGCSLPCGDAAGTSVSWSSRKCVSLLHFVPPGSFSVIASPVLLHSITNPGHQDVMASQHTSCF